MVQERAFNITVFIPVGYGASDKLSHHAMSGLQAMTDHADLGGGKENVSGLHTALHLTCDGDPTDKSSGESQTS